MRQQARTLHITEREAFANWLNRLSGEQRDAWHQDVSEIAALIGIVGSPQAQEILEEDQYRPYPFAELIKAIWMIHQAGYPLPVLQSLREGKGPERL